MVPNTHNKQTLFSIFNFWNAPHRPPKYQPPATQEMSTKRVKTISLTCPIIYGNTARLIPESEKTPEIIAANHTHTWTVFVRNPLQDNELLSQYISKITFKLHATYDQPSRTVESAPFEVTETGWGEFDIQIKITFHDFTLEKPIQFNHRLQLHPYGTQAKDSPIVESIQYEEIVFNEPTEALFEKMTLKPGNNLPEKSGKFNRQLERQEIHRLNNALSKVNSMIEGYRKRIVEKSRDDIVKNTITR